MSETLTMEQLEKMLKVKKKERLRMKTGKKALYVYFYMCIILIAFTMAMIFLGKDTTSLTILAAAGVGGLPFMYNIYEKNNTPIKLKHMEMDYIPNYDEQEGIY